jgi:hypothetical protein
MTEKSVDQVGGELHTLLRGLIDTVERSSGKLPFNQELMLALINGLNEKLGLLIAAQKEGVKTAMDAAEKAVVKAEVATDKRFEGLNELRKMAEDWRSEFARKSDLDLQIKGIADKIEDLKQRISDSDMKLGAIVARGVGRSDLWGYLIGGLLAGAAIASVIATFVHK